MGAVRVTLNVEILIVEQLNIQRAGAAPRLIEPGMRLILGDLGCVVTVVCVDNGVVHTAGAHLKHATPCGIGADGSMPLDRALACELATDWVSAWESADYYACADPDDLEFACPLAAIADFFNRETSWVDHDGWIERECPLEVTAYARACVSDAWLSNTAFELADQFEEIYAVEYGTPPDRRPFDRRSADCVDNQVRETLIAKLRTLIAETVARVPPANCSVVASRLYTEAEVKQIVRDAHPEWFEDFSPQDTTVNSLSL
jgi:hypothetical protein